MRFRIKEPKCISRVRAFLNASTGNAITNADNCNVYCKVDTTLTSFLQLAFSTFIEGVRAHTNCAVIFLLLQGMYFLYKTKLVPPDEYEILNMYFRNTLMR